MTTSQSAPRPKKQEQETASDEITEVAPGILRLQLPIDMPGLGHVNTYALEDRRGVALVDPGMPGPASWKALNLRLTQAGLSVKRVHTVVVTHSHPDHFGGAARLASEAGADVVTHLAFRTWFDADEEVDEDIDVFDDGIPDSEAPARRGEHDHLPPWKRPTPWGGKGFKPPLKRRLTWGLLGRLGRFGRMNPSGWTPPNPTNRLRDGDVLELAGREWVAMHTPGHTADHLCLVDHTEGVLLSGDHVLPTITPHIGGHMTEPDPLASFFSSLDKVAGLGDVRTVLPAHGHPFEDLVGRATSIKDHHVERLELLRKASAERGPATVEELSTHLFRPRSLGHMASAETYAHLEHLRLAGEAERWEEGGTLRYLVG